MQVFLGSTLSTWGQPLPALPQQRGGGRRWEREKERDGSGREEEREGEGRGPNIFLLHLDPYSSTYASGFRNPYK